jgi:hypothetical protein
MQKGCAFLSIELNGPKKASIDEGPHDGGGGGVNLHA